jgi:hypothetical protein
MNTDLTCRAYICFSIKEGSVAQNIKINDS